MDKKTEILITMPFSEGLVDKIRRTSPQVNVTIMPAKQADEVPVAIWNKVEVLYTSNVLPEPEQAPRLRWVQLHWAGADSMLGHSALQRPEVVVTTLSGAHAPQMGEYVLMMILALGHQLPALMENQRMKSWGTDRWERFKPIELRGSTVGIVGYGSIGREIARVLQPFQVTVLASKRNVMEPEDEGYTPVGMGDPTGSLFRRLYPPQAIKSMVKDCDFIVVCVPYTPENEGLIGADEFALMKPSAFLIDVSRGKVVDQAALAQALMKGKIAGAALDVFTEEPLAEDSPLWGLPNCLVTPHISGISGQYDERAVDLFTSNLQRYITGHILYNMINLERGY